MSNKKFKLALIAAFIFQVVLVGAMLADRYSTIKNGAEVTLQSRFVDPRDIFRGHYVTINLVAGQIGRDVPGATTKFSYRDPVFVSLKKGENGFWVAEAVSEELPQDGSSPVLQGEYWGTLNNDGGINVRFPFNRYFAPKERAQELEKLHAEQKLGIVLALNGKGGGVIKGITIDGELIYDEPLF